MAPSRARVVVVPTAITRRPSAARAVDGARDLSCQHHPLRRDGLLLDRVAAQRPEGRGTDMQSEGVELDPACLEPSQDLRREVQTRGGRRHRTRMARVDGLVALPVLAGWLGKARDVGRQGWQAMARQQIPNRAVEPLEEAATVGLDAHHAQPRSLLAARHQRHAQAAPAAGTDQGKPASPGRLLQEDDLHGSLASLDSREDAGRDHARVVDDQAVARAEKRRKVGKLSIGELPPSAIDDEQTGGISPLGRRLGDGGGGQPVVESAQLHAPSVHGRGAQGGARNRLRARRLSIEAPPYRVSRCARRD